jgi:RimJ/RimL family protein N-acetyltransferase
VRVLETARLLLRPLTIADEDDVFAYQSDPEIVRYIPWPVRTREQVREALHRFAGNGTVLAIVERTSGRVVGQMNLSIESDVDRHGEFGYVVGRAYARRGFAYEASVRLLDHAFETLDLHRVSARIDTRNLASAALAEKLGLRREAEFRENEWFKGEWSSTWIYAVLQSEWRAMRGTMERR